MCVFVCGVCVCLCVCLRVCVFVCVPVPRLLITRGMMWCNMDPIYWFNNFYSCYMTIIVGIVNGDGLCINMHEGK